MLANHSRADVNLAWPDAQIAVMGAAGAARIIHRREIQESDDPGATEARRTDEYEETFNNPYMAAQRGFVDDVIEAHATRPTLIRWLELVRTKIENRPTRKHGNIPL